MKSVLAGEEGNCRSWNSTRALNIRASFTQASGKRSGDPLARLACVAAEDYAWLCCHFLERVAESETGGKDRCWIEWGLACDGANSVGTEQLACAG